VKKSSPSIERGRSETATGRKMTDLLEDRRVNIEIVFRNSKELDSNEPVGTGKAVISFVKSEGGGGGVNCGYSVFDQ
jgi:hypothetical protein